jgi:HAE1 family hydrophobic/amphiphilic exporter-1
MLKTFIERPVLSTVISILIVVLGIIGLMLLPVEQYPNIAPPTVQVSATYPGANADVVMNSVVIPLEEQINGVEGMTYMTSSASNTGMANVTIYFEQGVNPDIAAVNVQNQVARATPLLPQEVVQIGVTVRKQQSSTILMISIASNNPDYDRTFVQNYANINILPQIKRVRGVGDANVFGARDYAMRIWLKPDVMAAYQINPPELIAALQEQNIEAAPGELGRNADQTFQYTLKYTGRLKSAEEFGNVIIRSRNGQLLRMKDVADVELGSLNYTVLSNLSGKESVAIGISQTAGSNAQEVIDDIKAELAQAEALFPPGLEIHYIMDANEFLDASIEKVIHTLLEAFLLVFLVVLVFLQDFRSTLIPAIAVPVAIVGTFFFLRLFGFSVNLLTLFALLLAIGIVVDDAIVVVEAVHAQLDAGMKDAKEATLKAMKEIAPAIVSITLVMSAVFIPVSFIGGTSGVFYTQFGLTLAIAIAISAVNALTLSPALCALFLKPHREEEEGRRRKGSLLRRFYALFNRFFQAGTQAYEASLHFLGKKGHRWITVAIIATATVLLFTLMRFIPSGFVPQEDSGGVMGLITMPPGSSLERTDSLVQEVVRIAEGIEHVDFVQNITGVNFQSGIGSSYATVMIKMEPWSKRKITTNEVVALMQQQTRHMHATFIFTGTPTLQGFGLSSGVEMQMQDRSGGDVNRFFEVTNRFLEAMRSRPEVMMARTTFDPNFPQKLIEANIPKIKEAGLTLGQVMATLQAYVGSMYISNFNIYGKQFRVMLQAAPEYRAKLDNLDGYYIQTASGEMAPVTEFLSITDVTGPQTLNRFNMYSSMNVMIVPNALGGYATGDVLNAVREEAARILPAGYGYDFSGMTREEVKSGSQTYLIFALCLIFVYLLLCALYESYILPLAVIFSLPIGLSGVFVFIYLGLMSGTGIVNNIYVQISLIMLIGLLAKNAILIVEYAIQRRQQGMSIIEAAVKGAVARLRPILMTSFAFIFGLLPLALATGAGAIGNKSIGISAIGGMLIGTLLGVLVIPSLYIIFQTIQDRFSRSGLVNSNDEVIRKVLSVGIVLVVGFSSCQVANRYQSPDVDLTDLYRDANPTDTTTIARIPWNHYFADTCLQTLIAEGLQANFDLRIAHTRIQQAEASLSIANAAYFPTASLVGQVTHNEPEARRGTQYALGVAMQWEIDIRGKLNRQARARYAQFLQSQAYRNLVQTSLVANIATSYYTLLALDEQRRITQETIGLLEESASTMQALMEAGVLNGAAVQQSRALLYSTQISLPGLDNRIRQLENALSVLTGRKPGAIDRQRIAIQNVPERMMHGVPAQLLALRPDVKQAELAFRAAFELRQAAQAALYPAVTLNAGSTAAFGATTLANFFSPENLVINLIGGLTQPLFAGNQLRGQLKIAKAQQQEALLNFEKAVLTAGQEVSDILYAFESSKRKDELRTRQIETLATAVFFTQELLKAGEANYTEVLTAEQNLLQAQLARVSDKLEQIQAVVNLYRALGGGADS